MIVEQIDFIWRNLPVLLTGALVTVQLSAAMVAVGLAVGFPLALLDVYGGRFARWLLVLPLVTIFRGVPTLVLLFIVYFGASSLGYEISGFLAAIIAIGVRSGIYQSRALRGALLSVRKGQLVAARSIGMSKWQMIRHVSLPQALRYYAPSFTNEYAVVLKESSLAYVLGVTELMRQGRYIISRTFGNSLTVYLTCAVIYLILVLVVTKLISHVEKRTAIPGFQLANDQDNGLRK